MLQRISINGKYEYKFWVISFHRFTEESGGFADLLASKFRRIKTSAAHQSIHTECGSTYFQLLAQTEDGVGEKEEEV